MITLLTINLTKHKHIVNFIINNNKIGTFVVSKKCLIALLVRLNPFHEIKFTLIFFL